MRCKIFNCDKVRKSQCCALCPHRSRCANPCLDAPERCGQTRPETTHELALESGIKEIDQKRANEIIETYKPEGRYLVRLGHGRGYIGIDNSTGNAWTEDFKTYKGCVTWLAGEMPREEIEE